jgi:hypothetical protein
MARSYSTGVVQANVRLRQRLPRLRHFSPSARACIRDDFTDADKACSPERFVKRAVVA